MKWIRFTFRSKLAAFFQINFEEIDNGRLQCEAIRNTWSQQRQKKRVFMSSMQANDCDPEPKRLRLSKLDVGVSVTMGVGDGRDSFADVGNFNECLSRRCASSCERRDVSVQVIFFRTLFSISLILQTFNF